MSETYFWLCLSAVAAGVINSIAGGGTLLTFPALFAALGSTAGASVIANATSTVALVPGALAAVWGFRRELKAVRRWVAILILPSVAGGYLGSRLVIAWPESFKAAVPWLILSAAVLFASQPLISRLMGISPVGGTITLRREVGAVILQFVISIYGGYFGAGAGILMLTSLGMMGLSNIHEMNALKSVLGTSINAMALLVFVRQGEVHWPFALAMAASGTVGGYLGASYSRKMNRHVVRWLVVAIGLSLACYYFWQQTR